MTERPIIDAQKCDGCGLCVTVCQCNALSVVKSVVIFVEAPECDWCTDCEAVCRTGAIMCPFEIVCPEP